MCQGARSVSENTHRRGDPDREPPQVPFWRPNPGTLVSMRNRCRVPGVAGMNTHRRHEYLGGRSGCA